MQDGIGVLVGIAPYVVAAIIVWAVFVARGSLATWMASVKSTEKAGVAWMVVNAVEQMFFDEEGEYKLEQAIDFLLEYFPNADREEMKFWIEAAVKRMNDAKPVL